MIFPVLFGIGSFPIVLCFWWLVVRKGKDKFVKFEDMDFDTDRYYETPEEIEKNRYANSLKGWAKFKYNFADNFCNGITYFYHRIE